MISQRHPNPLRDTRRPFADSTVATNPPVFAWRALPEARSWGLTVSRQADLSAPVIAVDGLAVPYYLPERALAAGRYHWQWRDDQGHDGQVFAFVVDASATVFEVPLAADLLAMISRDHPRIWVGPGELSAFRASRHGLRSGMWTELQIAAQGLLKQPHELAEPPYLPDYHTDHDGWFRAYNQAMVESRAFLSGAETLALAYLASGQQEYGKAACRRMVSVAQWRPDGPTWIEHNDEPHMSIVNWGPTICDWVWELFSADERDRLVEMFRRRGELAIRFMQSFGHYGSTHYGSHHGREIVFLGTMCLVFHDQIAEAREWLEWLRPLLCGLWPLWAGDDGAWAEGPHYGAAYVGVMARFAGALRSAAGIDLFQKRFWRGFIQWLRHCCPTDIEWIGFGDGSKYRCQADAISADLVRLVAGFTGSPGFGAYLAGLDANRPSLLGERGDLHYLAPMVYAFQPPSPPEPGPTAEPTRLLRVFPTAGWAALHTHLGEPEQDVVLTFRSSPFGNISHSHADQNDFSLHVAGTSLLVPSGVYDGWATNHHAHWVWHTKSANCLTLSDAGQLMRSEDAVGRIEDAYEDENLVYWRGHADAAYALQAERCRRHVVFLKPDSCFLLIDEFVARPGVVSSMQWNVHAWAPPNVDEAAGAFRVARHGSAVIGHVLWHAQGFFSVSDRADPPPIADGFEQPPLPEFHLRYTPWGLVEKGRNLGVVLCPEHASLPAATVETWRIGGDEIARTPGARIVVRSESIPAENGSPEIAQIEFAESRYSITGETPIARDLQ